jgi:hypothetical protein
LAWSRVAADAIAEGVPASDLDRVAGPTWTTLELTEARPAVFLKHVVTILLAIAPPGFRSDGHMELAEYARDPRRMRLPARYQFFLSLYHGPNARFVGYSARVEVETGRAEELIELAYPPLSCVLSIDSEAAIQTTNISEFAEVASDEVCVVDLDLLNGFGHTPFPADFRTLAAVRQERAAA